MKRKSYSITLALLLAACSQENSKSNLEEGDQQAALKPAPNASAVADRLAASGLPLMAAVAVTEDTDDNKLLGRPNGYTSKVFFHDGRHKGEGLNPDEQNTIEVFANVDDATSRREYIEGVISEMPLFTQYIIQNGTTVLRLDKSLLPSEAKEYEEALNNL